MRIRFSSLSVAAVVVAALIAAPVLSVFSNVLAGDTGALKGYFENPDRAIGKLLTVQYQGLTGKSGVPRFPVGLRLREDAA